MKLCAIGLRGIPGVMGGIETHCEHLYPRLARLDDRLEITIIGRSGYARACRIGNIRVVTLWAPRRKALETLVHTPLAILYARLFLQPDVVHLHAVGPGFFAPLARMLGFRVIGTHHAPDYDRAKFGFFGRLFLRTGEWMLAKFAHQVICVSSTIQTSLSIRHPREKDRFITIRNGAPPATGEDGSRERLMAELGVAPGGYILCVGRLDPSKAFQDVIAAFAKAKPGGLKLVIAGGSFGSDDYAAKLKASASQDVIFADERPSHEVQALYRDAALFVHPSYLEGFPLVVLEALAADAPVILSDIPAHLEVGLEKGCYYGAGDVDALAGLLARGDYQRLRCARRTHILQENDWNSVAQRHYGIIATCLRKRSGGRQGLVAPR
jgi:glycosyltransferase involved in cell wall biosynthesis